MYHVSSIKLSMEVNCMKLAKKCFEREPGLVIANFDLSVCNESVSLLSTSLSFLCVMAARNENLMA